jgi:ribosomal-protein-alanine N-acetyltransferase
MSAESPGSSGDRPARERPVIRELKLTDIALAAGLHNACFIDDPWNSAAFAEMMAIPGTFGFIACLIEDPLGLLLCRAVAGECEVLTLGVVETARGAGLGRDLLLAGLHRAGQFGVRKMFLEVAVDNGPAMGLYRSAGFSITAVRPGYYQRRQAPGPVDAAVMMKSLTDL